MHVAAREFRNKLFLTISAVSLWLGIATEARAEGLPPNPEEPINVIWYPDAPYALDQDGIPTGFEIDLWRMIAESRQIPYQIKRADSFKGMLESVGTGAADLAIGGILINENRSKRFNYTFPTSTSKMRIYTVSENTPTAIKVLKILLSRESILIFSGLTAMVTFFAIPVWILEHKDRKKILAPGALHELVYILQKTLMLSTDHTKRTTTRILSMASLFARVLITAYFASYILKLTSEELAGSQLSAKPTLNLSNIQQKIFAQVPASIQASMIKSRGARTIECQLEKECIEKLESGEADAILADSRTMKTLLDANPNLSNIKAASGNLMTLFIAFGMSKDFSQNDPRASLINDGIARSYYDGSHADLSRNWSLLQP